MPGLVLGRAADNELLRPVHVARRKPIAAAGQLGAHIRGALRGLVGRRGRAGRVGGVEAGFLLVARVNAGPLHKVPEGLEGEGLVDGLHLIEEVDRVEGGPGDTHAALVTAQPEQRENI